jgi:hypothetical protein
LGVCGFCGHEGLRICAQDRFLSGIELHDFVDALGGGRETGAEEECSERELGEAH